MRSVESYDDISAMISARLRPGVICNAMPDRAELEREIAQRSLYAESWAGGLVILRRRNTHDILNFWLNDASVPFSIEPERNTVLEIASRPRDAALRESAGFWKEAGFRGILSRVRLTRAAGECETPRIPISSAEKADFDEVSALLRASFSPLTGCIPSDESLKRIIENGEILVSRDENHSVTGLLHFKTGRASAEIRHLAVRENRRNRGIANELIAEFLSGIRYEKSMVWTGKSNFSALHLYEKNGFAADQYTSEVFLFEKGNQQ